MQTTELQLFNQEELQTTRILSAQINSNLPPAFPPKKNQPTQVNYNPQKSLESTLNAIFPEPQEENKLQKARRILGETAQGQTDEQLQTFTTELQYLIDSWLDVYEKQIFDGPTLQQLLRGG